MDGEYDDEQISFELLADANQRLLRRILAEPRERPCEVDTWKTFQDMLEARTNSNHEPSQKRGHR